jgi:hypothetical protein
MHRLPLIKRDIKRDIKRAPIEQIKKSRIKKQHLARRWRYGITQRQFARLVKIRNGKCDICGKVPSGKRKTLQIDHDHSTGKIRGLLCNSCNLGLGYLGDNERLVEKLQRYFIQSRIIPLKSPKCLLKSPKCSQILNEEEQIEEDLMKWMKSFF